jgi:hypothetical protein
VADLSDPVSPLQEAEMQVNNSSGCRNHSALHGGMGYSLIYLRSLDPTVEHLSSKCKALGSNAVYPYFKFEN